MSVTALRAGPAQDGMLQDGTLQALTLRKDAHEALVARAAALLPLLRDLEAASEARRSVHPDAIAAMRQAGLFRILQSRRLGGAELELRTMHEVVRMLATASASASWVLMVVLAHTWMLGMFDERVQDEIAADDADTIVSGSLAPAARAVPAEGGWRLTGQWPWASGCDHAKWSLVGVKVADGDASLAGAIHAMVPARDYAIEDNWFSLGLKGSGSKLIVMDDVFVPAHRTVPTAVLYGNASDWGARHPTWLHMMPVRVGLAYHVSAVILGLAQQFLAEFVGITRVRDDKYTGSRKADSPGLQFRIAEAEMDVRAAGLMLSSVADGFDALAAERRVATTDEMVEQRFAISYALERCRTTVERMFAAAGANATYDASPLQKLFRDISVATHHGTIDYDVNAEQLGRIRLGLPAMRPLT